MYQLVFSPRWFFGKDVIIDLVTVAALFTIFVFAIKYYKINKNKNYLWFGMAFLLMALSFIFKIATNFTIYYNVWHVKQIGPVLFTYKVLKKSDLLFYTGFLMYRVLMLLGLYVLFTRYIKQNNYVKILILYLLITIAYFSDYAYYVFHLTSFALLAMLAYHYFQNYQNRKVVSNLLLFASFALITLTQIIFVFVFYQPIFYVVAQMVQLVAYIMLIITLIMVQNYGKKKRKK
ncbi:hypothetical protein D6777_03240 [Candidatus Woesearchaeota archaeon]|nr:MAG: hypothetical protein D6777_03240 [Candidatus Woesearchaeota archaeon]